MTAIEIYGSTPRDIMEMEQVLRDQDRREIEITGYNVANALAASYQHALLKRTAFVDGEIAAMWGVCGIPLSMVGQPYLVTSQAVENVSPLTFARYYKREIPEMLRLFPVLENYVDADYDGAIRMLKIAGFTLDNPIQIGPAKHQFYRFYMKAQMN